MDIFGTCFIYGKFYVIHIFRDILLDILQDSMVEISLDRAIRNLREIPKVGFVIFFLTLDHPHNACKTVPLHSHTNDKHYYHKLSYETNFHNNATPHYNLFIK